MVGVWKVAPLRRDMLVLTVGRPDAFEDVGVRGDEVVFVVRRGWLNDILSGQVVGNLEYVGKLPPIPRERTHEKLRSKRVQLSHFDGELAREWSDVEISARRRGIWYRGWTTRHVVYG